MMNIYLGSDGYIYDSKTNREVDVNTINDYDWDEFIEATYPKDKQLLRQFWALSGNGKSKKAYSWDQMVEKNNKANEKNNTDDDPTYLDIREHNESGTTITEGIFYAIGGYRLQALFRTSGDFYEASKILLEEFSLKVSPSAIKKEYQRKRESIS